MQRNHRVIDKNKTDYMSVHNYKEHKDYYTRLLHNLQYNHAIIINYSISKSMELYSVTAPSHWVVSLGLHHYRYSQPSAKLGGYCPRKHYTGPTAHWGSM